MYEYNVMPSIQIYLSERLYWKVAQLAFKEDLSIGKTVQLIVESYFKAQEKGGVEIGKEDVQTGT